MNNFVSEYPKVVPVGDAAVVMVSDTEWRFVPRPETPRITFEQFEQLPKPPQPFRLELQEGRIVIVAPPKRKHNLMCDRLQKLLEQALTDAGYISRELPFQCEDSYRTVDVGVYSKLRWEAIPSDADYNPYPPDLVIEVLSRGNTRDEIEAKRRLCLEHGTREFWEVDLERQQVLLTLCDFSSRLYRPGDTIPIDALDAKTSLDVSLMFA